MKKILIINLGFLLAAVIANAHTVGANRPEIVLEGYGGVGLVFVADNNVFLCLDCLMQALGIPSADHKAAGKLVNNDDLTVFYDVVNVPLHYAVSLESLIYMVAEQRRR